MNLKCIIFTDLVKCKPCKYLGQRRSRFRFKCNLPIKSQAYKPHDMCHGGISFLKKLPKLMVRAVYDIDPAADVKDDITSSAQMYKDGHGGLLTTNFDAKADNVTTFRESYKPPQGPGVPLVGRKQEMLERMLYAKVSEEVHNEFNPPPEPVEFKSVTHKDFNIEGFTSKKPVPTIPHDYISEQPISFWTEHRDVTHGVSQVKTHDTVFRKNSSFSKPIEEYWNQPMPYEQEMVPKM